MAEAKKHLQNMEGSKWKWARPSGDAKTQADPDSSDEEEARLIELGEQGR